MDKAIIAQIARQVLEEFLIGHAAHWVVLAIVLIVVTAFSAWVGAYFSKRAEVSASKSKLEEILRQLQQTTAVQEEIKQRIADDFQRIRDDIAEERAQVARLEAQQFEIGTTSHMANVVFDKHVEFCEMYMKEVLATIHTLTASGPTRDALAHANTLLDIRQKNLTWLSDEVSQPLAGFEQAVRSLGATAHFTQSTYGHEHYAEQRTKALEKAEAMFQQILPHIHGEVVSPDSPSAAENAIRRVRDILEIDRLVKLRRLLIHRAHEGFARGSSKDGQAPAASTGA